MLSVVAVVNVLALRIEVVEDSSRVARVRGGENYYLKLSRQLSQNVSAVGTNVDSGLFVVKSTYH